MRTSLVNRLITCAAALGIASCLDPTAVLNATLTVVEGEDQTGTVSQPLADSLAVYVLHRSGLPLQDITVHWSVESGGGSVSPATSVTNEDGIARASRTLGSAAGEQTTRARVDGLGSVRITHTAVP
jgi:hypothetical protein